MSKKTHATLGFVYLFGNKRCFPLINVIFVGYVFINKKKCRSFLSTLLTEFRAPPLFISRNDGQFLNGTQPFGYNAAAVQIVVCMLYIGVVCAHNGSTTACLNETPPPLDPQDRRTTGNPNGIHYARRTRGLLRNATLYPANWTRQSQSAHAFTLAFGFSIG